MDFLYGLNENELSCLKLLECDIDHNHDNHNDNNNDTNKYDANTNINGNVASKLDRLDDIGMVIEGMINNISKLHDCDEGMGKLRKTQKRGLKYEGSNTRKRAKEGKIVSGTCQDEYGIAIRLEEGTLIKKQNGISTGYVNGTSMWQEKGVPCGNWRQGLHVFGTRWTNLLNYFDLNTWNFFCVYAT